MPTPIRPRAQALIALGLAAGLGGCVAAPAAALLQALPGTNRSSAILQDGQTSCKQVAQQSVSDPAENSNLPNLGALTLVLGSMIGGGQGGDISAAAGAVGGSRPAAMTTARDANTAQQQYNTAYAQCMSTQGTAVRGGSGGSPGMAPPGLLMPRTVADPDPVRIPRPQPDQAG